MSKCDSKGKKSKKAVRIFKWIGIIFLSIFLLLVAAVGVVIWQLDRIVTKGIRVVGTELVGTKVDVKNVAIKPFEAAVQINGFSVGNPEGFHKPEAIKVGNFFVDVDLNSVSSDTLIIDYIELSDVEVDLEYSLSKGLNLDVLKENIKNSANKFKGAAQPQEQTADQTATAQPEAKPEAQPEAKPEAQPEAQADDTQKPEENAAQKKVVIRKLVLKDIKFTFSSKTLNISAPLPLPDITMENIGEGKNIAEIVEEVLDELWKNILFVLENSKEFTDQFEKTMKETYDKAEKAVKELRDNPEKLKEVALQLVDKDKTPKAVKELIDNPEKAMEATLQFLDKGFEMSDGEVRTGMETGSKVLDENKDELKGALKGLFNRKKNKDKNKDK